MDPDRIELALSGLEPDARALVELSLIRDVADEDIASLLGTDEEAVRSRREDALAILATALGASSKEEVGALVHDMRELPQVRWRDDEGPAESEPEPEPEPPASAVVQPGAKRKRRAGPVPLLGVLVAGVVALVLALSGGDDDSGTAAGGEQKAAEPAPPPAPGKRAKLEPVAGGTAEGNVEVKGNSLDLSVSGLPDPGRAGYVVWLYNSLSEARPLSGPQSEPAFRLKVTLPEGAGSYRYLDVSLEPADSNGNHSGQSVLRVPLSDLQ